MAGKKWRIGLMSDYLTSEYAENLINGIKNFCMENDLELLLFQMGDIRKTNPEYNNFEYAAMASHINSKNLDGIIVTASTFLHSLSTEEYERFLHQFEPLKVVNIASEVPSIHSVLSDSEQAYEALMQYIIKEQGCTRLALMGVDSNSPEVVQRTTIFKKALADNGIAPESATYFKTKFDYSAAYRELTNYRREHGVIDFDAIIALNDETAFACVDFCTRRMNMNVPNDIIITGFDNIQRASFSTPTLTSVNQQVEYIGFTAAQTVYNLLRGKEVPLLQKVKAKTILRTSSAKNREVQKSFIGNNYISVDTRTARDFTSTFSVSEWFNKRNQILQAANFYNSLGSSVLYEEIGPTIVNALRQFGFQGTAVVLYDHPVDSPVPFDFFKFPQKARLIAGFDYELVFNTNNLEEPIYFNPEDCILPHGKLKFPSCGTIITALFQGFVQYGYIALRCDAYDLGVYDLIQHAVSALVASSYSYTKLLEEQKEMSSQNKKLDIIAHTDELTGLNNRRGFMDFGQEALNISENINQSGLIVFCDMDGLKTINDTYGHEAGDKAIKAQADILNNTFRSNDILGRIGGDEFALVCPGLTEENFQKIRERVAKACKEWTKHNKSKFALSISMGKVKFPDIEHGYKMDYLLSQADGQLYEEKRFKKRKRK